ncbi:transmembrane protein 184C-like [Pollicipes pollicipes]|uniref:transmembrane protein 184C-like n=1 Tax=Pollicipes pollicipes TaxID=41117 RepID=UPI00188533D6|nr:transmembrane protein 184C-like [Pollicipes pollicipes]XP_037075606.1 transmembrane protein 184C-like [Pollicipes pollicipes]
MPLVLRSWRQWIQPVVMLLYGIILVICLPVLVVYMEHAGTRIKFEAWLIGSVFAFLTLPIALWEIIMHLVNYTKPPLQQRIIRILWMVPVYTLNAWMGLTFPHYTIYFDLGRECYEAYVIYNFMMYLLITLNEHMDLESVLATRPDLAHICPFCCLRPWRMGRELVQRCKHFILQYTVVRPVTSCIAFVASLFGAYGEGTFEPDRLFLYVALVNNISQLLAMYSLVLFYRATREFLKPVRPLAKFLVIKCVVFFSFFQEFIISVLVYAGVISTWFGVQDASDVHVISESIQNFLICIEMLLAAMAHMYAFSHVPYRDPDVYQGDCCAAFRNMWDVSDVSQDVKEHFSVVGSSVARRLSRRPARHASGERAPLLDESAPDEEEAQAAGGAPYTELDR